VKLLVVKEQLLAGGEDKVFSAVHAFENPILDAITAGLNE
jgi:hypothetical protein